MFKIHRSHLICFHAYHYQYIIYVNEQVKIFILNNYIFVFMNRIFQNATLPESAKRTCIELMKYVYLLSDIYYYLCVRLGLCLLARKHQQLRHLSEHPG